MFKILWSIFVTCILLETPVLSQNKDLSTKWRVPTGHCDPICSCQMDGLYYSEGETWRRKNEPCTTYRCETDGTITTTGKGCLYKNECKQVNSTWTEACNTFTCIEGNAVSFYKLTEAGCSTAKADCLRVGDQIEDGCNILECQMNETTLSLNIIKTGCSVEDACIDIGSYWHDGCTIFTCDNVNNTPVSRVLLDEVMQWPEGNYALLKPEAGCPNDVPGQWTEGSRLHFSTGRNYFSNPLTLHGNYSPDFMHHEFCIHGTVSSKPSTLKYKTYWEPGSYCILRRKGNCPRGFSDGYLMFDDKERNNSTVSTTSGDLPDGDYGPDTGLYFCCRKDGSVHTPLVLPKEENFVLFMNKGETACQNVRDESYALIGRPKDHLNVTPYAMSVDPMTAVNRISVYKDCMDHSIQSFTFNGESGDKHQHRGQVPSIRIANNDLTLQFCHYSHKGCGCTDESGAFIAAHSQKEINCTTKKCVSEKGKTSLEIVTGGCSTNGTCKMEGTTWTEFLGDTCIKKACIRVIDNGTIDFEIDESPPGCTDGEICQDVGTEIYRECFTSQCTLDTSANISMFKVIKADCPWLETCKASNSTWEHNCMMYQCDMSLVSGQYKWNVQPVGYGCSDGKGNCYEVGQNVSGPCFEAVCTLNENKTVVFLDVQKGGCVWKDICKPINSTWTEGCHHYKCEWIDTNNGFTALVNATNVSCEWKDKCYSQDDVWSDGCVDYKCIVTRKDGNVNWSVKTARLACKDFNGNCIPVGDEVTNNCVTYKCSVLEQNRIGLNVVASGCSWNNTCISENTKWNDTKKCVEYNCQRINRGRGAMMQVTVSAYGCLFNNTCMDVNSTWPDGCRTRKCVVSRANRMLQRSIAPISAGCDDEGICRNVGYIKLTESCMKYRCMYNETFKDAFFSLVSGECRASDGSCKPVGSQWTDKTKSSCIVYECRQEHLGYLSKAVEQRCLDASGQCIEVGKFGFKAFVDGKLRDNCSCRPSQTNTRLISVFC